MRVGPSRRFVVVGLATVAVVAAAILTVALSRNGEPTGANAAMASTPGPPPESRERPEPLPSQLWAPPGTRATSVSEDELRQRAAAWRTLTGRKVAELLPDASAVTPGGWATEGEGELVVRPARYIGFVAYRLDGRRYSVSLTVSAPASPVPGPEWVCANSLGECTRTAIGDGYLTTESWTQREGRHSVLAVTHFRADGGVVSALGHNGDPFAGGEPELHRDIPITTAQLTTLATDPGFTF